jgi:hypothetical protein
VIGVNSIMANQAKLWASGDVRVLLQFGRKTRHPLLPNVPLATELTRDSEALAAVAFTEAPLSMALPFVAPAGVPAERAAAQLATPGFDARRTAATEVPIALEPLVNGAQESAQIAAFAPNKIELDVSAQSRGLLVLSENYYPGWRATIDGQAAPIYRAFGALRGLVVAPGRSRVVLRYAPASVYWGALLSLMAFAGTLAAIWLRRRS